MECSILIYDISKNGKTNYNKVFADHVGRNFTPFNDEVSGEINSAAVASYQL